MQQLLSNYSFAEILLFAIVIAFAIKEIVDFVDWGYSKAKQKISKDQKPKDLEEKLNQTIKMQQQEIEQLREKEKALSSSMGSLDEKLTILINSDRDDIKAWITAQHHHFVLKGSIDYYSFDCISKRYEHYKIEGGNTFIDELMEELSNLPKTGEKFIKD